MSFGRLGLRGLGLGRLGGGSGGSSGVPPVVGPNAPVLAMDPSWDTTQASPAFTIDIDDTIAEGDDVRLQIQVAGGDWSSPVSDTTHTITSGEDSANEIDLSLAALGNDDYEARALVNDGTTDSDWSNVVSFTVDAAPDYLGPGDVISNWFAWYSPVRAYSAAFAAGGGAIMDLVDQAGANQITINILPTGFVDVSAITAWVSANSVSTIKVKQVYDQTGNSRHVLQATLANMPTLTLSADPTGNYPVLTASGVQHLATSSSQTLAQPITFSAVLNRASGETAIGGAIGGASGVIFGGGTGDNLIAVHAGSEVNRSALNNQWNAASAMAKSASSVVNVAGAETSGNAGANNLGSAIRLFRAAAVQFVDKIAEAGLIGLDSTTTDRNNLYANQSAAYESNV